MAADGTKQIRIDPDLAKRLKIVAAEADTTVREWASKALRVALDQGAKQRRKRETVTFLET